MDLPATGVCSATLGVKAIAEQFGLAPDTPARLIAATTRHLDGHTSAADAVLTAAAELGIDKSAALQLAAFAAGQFRLPVTMEGGARSSSCPSLGRRPPHALHNRGPGRCVAGDA